MTATIPAHLKDNLRGGYEEWTALTHPDHEGPFHPWSTPYDLREQGKLLLWRRGLDVPLLVDAARVTEWTFDHPSWCAQGGSCLTTAGSGSLLHQSKGYTIRHDGKTSGPAFDVTMRLEAFSDLEKDDEPLIQLQVSGELEAGTIVLSAGDLRTLAGILTEHADTFQKMIDHKTTTTGDAR